jgi:hypothetical protein
MLPLLELRQVFMTAERTECDRLMLYDLRSSVTKRLCTYPTHFLSQRYPIRGLAILNHHAGESTWRSKQRKKQIPKKTQPFSSQLLESYKVKYQKYK